VSPAAVALTVRPVDETLFDDLQTVLGTRGQPARCQCQGYRLNWYGQHSDDVEGRRDLLRDQAAEGLGLLAHLDGQPVGWCAMAPRPDYTHLRQTTWRGRQEDRSDASIWAVTCFVTRAGFRRAGVSRALAAATPEYARERGARVVEAYPMRPEPGKDVTWGEMHVGALSAFLAAGYRIVHEPSLRRVVVRYEF
jgi:GNAT superfamily N-acetyltransferase